MQLAWSSSDPQVPNDTLSTLVAEQATYPTWITAKDYGVPKHVFLNANITDAREAVRVMLGQ